MVPVKRTYPCPRCERQIPAHESTCPGCGVDLKALALIDELPDVCFNEALRAVRQNRWAEAVQQLATAIHYRPGDGEVWIVLGKVYAQLQRMEEALTCFARAQMCGSGEEAADCMRACGVKPFDGSDLMGA